VESATKGMGIRLKKRREEGMGENLLVNAPPPPQKKLLCIY